VICLRYVIWNYWLSGMKVTLAAWSKASTVFACSNTEIVGSNPTGGMFVCVYSVLVLACVYREIVILIKRS
jgi:hypothetical protein